RIDPAPCVPELSFHECHVKVPTLCARGHGGGRRIWAAFPGDHMRHRTAWVFVLTSVTWCAYGSAAGVVSDPEATQSAEVASETGFSVLQDFRVPGASLVKYPKVAFAQGRVLLAGTSGDTRQARLWSKAPGDAAFGAPEVLGAGASNPDYS